MESGRIVEYIDRQKILCAVVLEVKKKRLRLLTENNKEVNLSAGRLSHQCDLRLDLSQGRDKMVNALKTIATRRNALIGNVDIQELWEVLNTEQEWIDLGTMTEFCFPGDSTGDHESAVVRAFFQDRLYFKFNPDRFFPNSENKVDQIVMRNREAERRARIIEKGGRWLRRLAEADAGQNPEKSDGQTAEFTRILRSFYLFGKESPHYGLGRDLMAKAGIGNGENLFPLLVDIGEFSENENIEILRHEVPVEFSPEVIAASERLVARDSDFLRDPARTDLTDLPTMTIDGQSTLDFDDALSLERREDHYRLGVHIADVGHFIKRGDVIDGAGAERSSSIYTPDQRISMLPAALAEGLCSLKADRLRPAISVMVRLDAGANIFGWEIVPSLIRVRDQLTYYDVNLMAEDHPDIITLCRIAESFRKKRIDAGAVQITLPEIHIWIGDDGRINVNRINRESPGRRLVAETMIMANWLMAKFLAENGLPAIYRSQPKPRERLYKGEEGTLFQNHMQRRLLNRFVLGSKPESHSGLGLDAYVTATSPIRKYFDLITQRQIRARLGLEEPYSSEEIDRMILMLEQPMSRVFMVQRSRNRYWLLKYLEGRVGTKEEAIVLTRRRNAYQILLKEYMIECDLPLATGINLKPEDLIQVTIQQVDARRDRLSVFMG